MLAEVGGTPRAGHIIRLQFRFSTSSPITRFSSHDRELHFWPRPFAGFWPVTNLHYNAFLMRSLLLPSPTPMRYQENYATILQFVNPCPNSILLDRASEIPQTATDLRLKFIPRLRMQETLSLSLLVLFNALLNF